MLSCIVWGSDKETIHAQYRHSHHRPNYIAVEPVDTEGQLFSKVNQQDLLKVWETAWSRAGARMTPSYSF